MSEDSVETATGHIPTPDGGAMDVYVDGERADFRDGYRDGAEVTHRHDEGVLSVMVTGKECLGITNVSGEHWDDDEEEFWTDGEPVAFDHEPTDNDVLRFEADNDYDYTVEIRSVESAGGTDEDVANDGLYDKYEVTKDGEAVPNAFVLEPESDSAAREVLIRYAETTDDEKLASDIRQWVETLCTRGDV